MLKFKVSFGGNLNRTLLVLKRNIINDLEGMELYQNG